MGSMEVGTKMGERAKIKKRDNMEMGRKWRQIRGVERLEYSVFNIDHLVVKDARVLCDEV